MTIGNLNRSTDLKPISLNGLCAIWATEEIHVALAGAAALADQAETPQRIRGAMGRILHAAASEAARANSPCTFRPVSGWDIFHRVQGKLPNGRDIPLPFVIACEPVGKDLLITLRLFGRAIEWGSEMRAAIISGLRNGLTDGRGKFAVYTVLAAETQRQKGWKTQPLTSPITMEFLTPVLQSRAGAPIFDAVSLLKGLAARIAGLAWWHDRELLLDRDDIDAAVRSMIAGAQSDLRPVTSTRRNNSNGGVVGQIGTVGWLRCPPPEERLATLLQLGVEAHIGAKTTAGAGRYLLRIE
jgi:hypothetical protein